MYTIKTVIVSHCLALENCLCAEADSDDSPDRGTSRLHRKLLKATFDTHCNVVENV